MTHSTDITTLARWLAADFSNQQQAFDNPPLFAHIRVCIRPLPYQLLNGLSLYVEQAYDIALNQPYRVRILKLLSLEDYINIENYTIDQEAEFYGGSRDPKRLENLKTKNLKRLPTIIPTVTLKKMGILINNPFIISNIMNIEIIIYFSIINT